MEQNEKLIMVHYLPTVGEPPVNYTEYKKNVLLDFTDFRHIFMPTLGREGVEVIGL